MGSEHRPLFVNAFPLGLRSLTRQKSNVKNGSTELSIPWYCVAQSSGNQRISRRKLLAGSAAAIILHHVPLSHAGTADVRVADFGKLLGRGERERLERVLASLEESNGLRVRVLTVTNGVSATNVFDQSNTDVLLVADTRGGNLLYTRVNDSVYAKLPRSFWIELPNRFGTQFYVRENGADGAIFAAVNAIVNCTESGSRICKAVPGVSSDQLGVSVASAGLAGAIFGAAARTDGEQFNFAFVLLFAPIWSIFFVSFGLGPVLTRLDGLWHFESILVTAVFAVVAASIWFWVPRGLGPSPGSKTKT